MKKLLIILLLSLTIISIVGCTNENKKVENVSKIELNDINMDEEIDKISKIEIPNSIYSNLTGEKYKESIKNLKFKEAQDVLREYLPFDGEGMYVDREEYYDDRYLKIIVYNYSKLSVLSDEKKQEYVNTLLAFHEAISTQLKEKYDVGLAINIVDADECYYIIGADGFCWNKGFLD